MDVVVGRSIRRTEATIRVGLTELSREASYAITLIPHFLTGTRETEPEVVPELAKARL